MKSFDPVVPPSPRLLILGSYPSPKSFASQFYYGHPRNRFWPLLAELLQEQIPSSVEEKRCLLFQYHIALWDVLESCSIVGAADSSIKDPVINDIPALIAEHHIPAVFLNGSKAAALFEKHCLPCAAPYFKLPSTSPANAAYSMERLHADWKKILQYCQD